MSSNSSALPSPGDDVEPSAGGVVDPAARPVRRSFTAAYRARVVAEYEAAPHGSKAAVLRREGLYQSQIRRWAATRDALNSGAPSSRRPHRATSSGVGKDEAARLRAENQRLTRRFTESSRATASPQEGSMLLTRRFTESSRATASPQEGSMLLTCELAKSQAVVEIMGKLQGLLETISESAGTPTSSKPR